MLYNYEQIKELLPHRYPFLLIDKVIEIKEIDGIKTIIAQKCVSGNEPFFEGHFPNYAVMPGVLVLEAMAQAGACYVLSQDEYKGKLVLFTGADKVKWRYQVVPGDVITFEVSLDNIRHNIGTGHGKALVDGKVACEANISFIIK
ncbi:MAG: 3-hydroxyacyl-ACP dehydratase FabZ [Acholeplasmatales bacterium]|nr:3-hydroxyacyl-ACP dehydratase FabZ [Acholeplasmatales bacterium]